MHCGFHTSVNEIDFSVGDVRITDETLIIETKGSS